MRQRPDAAELEALADEILRDAPLPDDPKERSLEQRMAMKARAIADYDREQGAADMERELSLFAALYGADDVAHAGDDDEGRVASLNRRLASEIRSGAWDRSPERIRSLLMEQVRARLARTNPKFLKAKLGG